MKREATNILAAVVGVILLAAGGPWLVGQVRSLPQSKHLAARADQRIVTLEVSGMTCSGCASRIEQELTATNGVNAAEVRLGQDRAYVVCEQALPDSALLGAVHRAGPGFLAAVLRR